MRFQSQLVCTVSFGLVALTIVSKPKQREPKSSVTKHARVARGRYKEETRTSTLRTLRNKEVSQVKPDLLQRVNSSYLPYARQHKYKYIIYRTLRPIYKYIYKKRSRHQNLNINEASRNANEIWKQLPSLAQTWSFFFQAGIVIAFDRA